MGGLGIPSLKNIAEKLTLTKRSSLKTNRDAEMQAIWRETSVKNVEIDSRLLTNDLITAKRGLNSEFVSKCLDHVDTLTVQGPLISSINSVLKKSEISRWSQITNKLPEASFKFVRKGVQQQLATASNLMKWGRTQSNLCLFCKIIQTNKHVLSNCSTEGSLARYTDRHN